MGLENPVRERLGRTLADAARPRSVRHAVRPPGLLGDLTDEDYQLIELEPTESYWLSYLAAPIFDAVGRVTLALTLVGFPRQLHGDEVSRSRQAAARRLRRGHRRPSMGASPSPTTESSPPMEAVR